MFQRTCLLVAMLFAASLSVAEEWNANWPCFRGPAFTGVAPQGNPPTTWSEDSNVKWKVAIPGKGSGSPIVWGDHIYLQTAIKTDRTTLAEDTASWSTSSAYHLTALQTDTLLAQSEPGNPADQQGRRGGGRGPGGRRGGFRFGGAEKPTNVYEFIVLCVDRNSGKILWQQTACEAIPHEAHHGTASFASYTPVTDGKNLYVSFGSRGVYSYTLDGELRWKRDLGDMSTRFSFGEGSSPALYGDTLMVNWDHEGQSYIYALDANTGNIQWRKERDEETTWLTPLIVEYDGKVQVVVNGMNKARGYDLKTGDVLWECGGQAMGAIPTSVVYKDLVFCMTGHRGSALYAIPLGSKGDITDSDQIAWKLDRDTPYVPSPLLYDDKLYFTKSNNAILSCYEAGTGEEVFKTKRLPDMDTLYASPVAAAGRIYFSGRNGVTTVVKHGDDFEVLATNTLNEPIDATPAIVGDEMIIRTAGHLYCIAE